jgi:hypothetical protein
VASQARASRIQIEAWQAFAHVPIIGECKANVNDRPRSASIDPLAAVAFNDPIQTFPNFVAEAQKDLKSRSDFSPLDFRKLTLPGEQRQAFLETLREKAS